MKNDQATGKAFRHQRCDSFVHLDPDPHYQMRILADLFNKHRKSTNDAMPKKKKIITPTDPEGKIITSTKEATKSKF
jgi:hypothetical protein